MIYLAGPFFNPVQLEAAQRVRDLCKQYKRDHYAPVDHGVVLKTPEQAQQIFDENCEALRMANHVLVHLEWLMPAGDELHLVRNGLVAPAPIALPDTGTVWEMGYAASLADDFNEPLVVAYTVQPAPKLNLMLARSAQGYLNGWAEVEEFVRTLELLPHQREFKGKEF